MDNILKLLLGVLGVAALITFVTSSLSFDSTPPAPAIAAPVGTSAPPLNENNENQPPEEIVDEGSPEEDGEDILAMGEPVIDGNPYGSSNQQNLQNEIQIPQEQVPGVGYYGQAPMPGYNLQQVNVQRPVSSEFSSINNGQ